MILTHSVKVCLATSPCDMRKSFEGLSAIVATQLREDILSRKLFVFSNKSRNRIKLLYWDGSGLWVMAKRLEKGGFKWPKSLQSKDGKMQLKPEVLEMLLSGIDLKAGAQRAWYETPHKDG